MGMGHSEDLVPKSREPLERPFIKLTGKDGNAYAIMGRVQQACRRAKWPKECIDGLFDRMQSGDYNELLRVVRAECDWE